MYFKTFLLRLSKKRYLLAALSGFLTALTFVYSGLYLLTWISLVPFIYAFIAPGKKRAFRIAFVYAFTFYLIVYSWFLHMHPLDWLGIDNSFSLLTAIGIWIGASLVHTTVFALLFKFFGAVRPKNAAFPFVLASMWVVMEWLQEFTAFAFPWARLALSQYRFTAGIQSVSILGSLFVSYLIAAFNALIAYGLFKGVKNIKLNKGIYITAAAIFLCNLLFGIVTLELKKDGGSYETVKVAAVQGNINPVDKWSKSASETFEVFMNLSGNAAADGAKIILWPETAIPTLINAGSQYDGKLKAFAKENNVYIVAGAFSSDSNNKYNSLIVYNNDGIREETTYNKINLVPFGEITPYADFFDFFFDTFPGLSMGQDISEGKDIVVFDSVYGKFSTAICFDSVFSRYSQAAVKNGSQLLLIATNDAYYRDSGNPYQHNAHAALRAVETDRYVVRAANTGISSIIDNRGIYMETIALNEEGYITADIKMKDNKTLYAIVGDVIAPLSILLVLLAGVKKLYDRKNLNSTSNTDNRNLNSTSNTDNRNLNKAGNTDNIDSN